MFNWFTILYGFIISVVVFMAYPFAYMFMYGKVSKKKALILSAINVVLASITFFSIQFLGIGKYIDADWMPKEVGYVIATVMFATLYLFIAILLLHDKKMDDEKTEPGHYSAEAIIGFVLSLVGLFLIPLVFGIVALRFSAYGLNNTERNGVKGRGLAIAGLVISTINIAYGALALIWLIGILLAL